MPKSGKHSLRIRRANFKCEWHEANEGRTTMCQFSETIVLVHGGFVDGAGWEGVYRILKKDGYNVSIVQNPTTSLADDVPASKHLLSQTAGPVVLVGHSYGAAVIPEAGADPKVAGL